MARAFPRFCSRCGAAIVPGQTVCARCGLNLVSRITQPVSTTSSPERVSSPPSRSIGRNRRPGKFGVLLLLLIVLVLLGSIGYLSAGLLGIHLPSLGSINQPQITSISIGAPVVYAGVDVTVLDAQQAQRFVDDPKMNNTSNAVRVHLQASNKTSDAINLGYNNSVSLLAPGGKTIKPIYMQASSIIAAGAAQTNAIDFVVPLDVKMSQLMLFLGTSHEAQIQIPLVAHPDVSRYAAKSTTLNGQTQYLGLNWTLTNEVSQLSIPGQQADAGMRYLILTLKVDNTLSQTAISGSPYDYMRLKAGTTATAPRAITLPVSFSAGETGRTGTVTFLVPQNVMAVTLIFLAQGGFDQAAIDFQA